MHNLSIAAALAAVATVLPAQSPLTTAYNYNNYNSIGGTVFFDLNVAVPVSLTQIDVNCSPLSTVTGSGTLNVYTAAATYIGNELSPSAWTLVGTGTLTINAPNVASICILRSPVVLGAGAVGIMLEGQGFSLAYTNGIGTNQTFTTVEMTLNAGASANAPYTAAFTPRLFNGALHYTSGSSVASFQTYGAGCYSKARSYYETFPTTAGFDLGSTTATNSFQHIFTGNSYVIIPGNGTWRTPTGTNLALGDDAEVSQSLPFTFPFPGGTTTQLTICSNGFISPGLGNGAAYVPDVNGWLNGNPRYCPYWHDLNPTAGGQVMFDVDPTAGAAYVTWLGVAVYGAGGSNTFQVAFFATGVVEYRYQVMGGQATTTSTVAVGWSPGGAARNPGMRDISATLPFSTDATDTAPLALTASARPVLGTPINLVTSQIPAGSLAGVMILSFTRHDPGLPLASLGMTDCSQYVGLDVTRIFVVGGAGNSMPINIPSAPIHAGTRVRCQSATFSPGVNPLGVLASNGLELKLDVQ